MSAAATLARMLPRLLPCLLPPDCGGGGDALTGPHAVRLNKATVIAVYAHKGGAFKTSTVRELATTMAMQGKRVAMVDADPQRNLTGFWAAPAPADTAAAAAPPDVASAGCPIKQFDLHLGAALPPPSCDVRPNVYTVLEPLMDGDRGRFQKTRVPLHRVECADIRRASGELLLLPGSPDLVRIEALLEQGRAMMQPNWVGAFAALFTKMGAEHELDYVFVDCSPAAGVLNKLIVASSDLILPSVAPDANNCGSMDAMLRYVLPSWMRYRADHALRICGPRELPDEQAEFRLSPRPPRLLPALVHRFTVASDGTVAPPDSEHIRALRAMVRPDSLVATAAEPGARVQMVSAGADHVIAFMPALDPATLDTAHAQRSPMVLLPRDDDAQLRDVVWPAWESLARWLIVDVVPR